MFKNLKNFFKNFVVSINILLKFIKFINNYLKYFKIKLVLAIYKQFFSYCFR